MEDLIAALPDELRGPDTKIAKIAAGLSGAGVYRVEAGGRAFVLKVANAAEPLAAWQRRVHVQRLAGAAGVAPHVVHVDEARRAVVSEHVADRSFVAYYMNPASRADAIAQLGQTLRRVHALPLPPGESRDPRALLAELWATLASFGVPAFVGDAVRALLAATPPPADRPLALCHNDVNPSNLAYDGARIVLLDWDTAGANDPFIDLAAAALFLRMDEPSCRALLAAHDGGAQVDALPARFGYSRRLVGVVCGVLFLHLARTGGHAGDAAAAATPLAELYQQMRAGGLDVRSAGGQFRFGLALVAETLD